MKVSGRRVPGVPFNGRNDRDEDLLLFKELHKREKDRLASLLQPVSDEFEPNGGNNTVYRIASGKKGPGYEFFGENDKNDYDWLKTPPATPLFPSLEMEANAQQRVVQREIPIIRPLSQFADNTEALKRSNGGPKSLNTKPNYKIPLRAVTPSQRPSISSIETKSTAKVAPILNQKMAQFTTDLNKKTNVIANTAKPTNQKESQINFLASNLSRDTKTKPRSRGVSPSVRSTIPAQIPGFSNDTPSNLRTNIRATSATRGSPAANPTLSVHQKPDPAPRPIRQSCSPSVTRGRKESEGNLVTQKGNILTASNGTQIFGSRMVEKVMNARKLGAEEREAKAKLQSTTNTNNNSANGSTSGFGKMMPKSSSVMALKHMEIKQDRINPRRYIGFVPGRSPTDINTSYK